MSLLNKASLIQIPSGYKDGTLYSAKPINGDGDFTFSRGSNLAATRVNSEGLIEKGRENRLLQSNNFNTSPYSPAFATLTSGFEGYDGSNDGWKVASTTIGSETRIRQSQTFTTGEVITLSVYMKKGNVNFGIVRNYAITGGGRAWFDLENGTVATENSGINGSIEDVGNGWYRCSIWGVINTTGAVDISPAPSDGDYLADAVGEFIYIQDSMLNEGLVATDYIPTTTTTAQAGILEDMPRLDYSGGATCGSLILEPQRTNLVYQSEYLGAWSAANCTLTANSITSPEGVVNSFKITENSAASTQHRVSLGSIGGSSATYTMSAYVKNSSGTRMAYIDMGLVTAHFNFTTETIYSATGTADWEDVGNGWYRIWVTSNSAISVGTCYVGLSVNNNETYSGDGTSAIEFYGIQLEAGGYPTSYIPTYGSSVTRSADACSKTGISSLIGQTEGTLFLELSSLSDSVVNEQISLSDGTDANTIKFVIGSVVGGVSAQGRLSSITQFSITKATTDFVSNKKLALAYKANDFVFYYNGEQVGIDASGSIPAMSVFAFSTGASTFAATVNVKEAILFPTRLTNDELASLTTI
jgi:hypothetical protein